MPKFRCEHCNQKIAAADKYMGRRVRCPRCKQPARVPDEVKPVKELAPAEFVEAAKFEPLVAHASETPAETAREVDHPTKVESPVFSTNEPDPAAAFSEWLSGPAASEQPPQNVEEHPASDVTSEDSPTIVVPTSEVIDRPTRRRRREASNDEVADLLRTLRRREELAAEKSPVSMTVPAPISDNYAGNYVGLRALGWASLGMGGVAIALACVPVTVPYALPTGSAGFLLGLTGIVLAAGRRARRVHLLVAGLTTSAIAIGAPVLGALGYLPGGSKNVRPHAGSTPSVTVAAAGNATTEPSDSVIAEPYIEATSPVILNHVEIRVASAKVLQPAVYSGDFDSLLTMSERRMQITLHLRDLGREAVTYEPWRKGDGTNADAKLSDADGNALAIDVSADKPGVPATLPIGSLKGTVSLAPGAPTASDVLLFAPPENSHEDVKLDLPGENLGAPASTIHLLIPAAMIEE